MGKKVGGAKIFEVYLNYSLQVLLFVYTYA